MDKKLQNKIQVIKKIAKNMTLLYVEDNAGLRNNMEKLLRRVFPNVISAEDGEAGYQKFIEYNPQIIISDIKIPKLNGFNMIQKIKAVNSEGKIMILSAYDEKKYLHLAIELGVHAYLQKPVSVDELIKALYKAVIVIREEENEKLFSTQIQNIFNYQNNMVVMMDEEGEFLLCNQRFNEFFDVKNLDEFKEKYPDPNQLLLPHNEFLFSTESMPWYKAVNENYGILYHTKISNSLGELRHLILKAREVPEKEGYSVLSFDDVTELNLMALFDSEEAQNDMKEQTTKSILNFMRIVKNNSSEVKLHNFYKGLTIVNSAVILDITDTTVSLKTSNTQLKAINIKKATTMTSEIFPKNIVCKDIKNIDLDNQKIVMDNLSFSSTNLDDRKYIRLEPEKKHTCSLFYKDIKIMGDTRIVDLSEVSVKVEILALPAGMAMGETLKVSMNLDLNGKVISITTDAEVYRIDENLKSYYVVMLYDLEAKKRKEITDYIAVRQMALIREFKQLTIECE